MKHFKANFVRKLRLNLAEDEQKGDLSIEQIQCMKIIENTPKSVMVETNVKKLSNQ